MFAVLTPGRPIISNFTSEDGKHFLLGSLPMPTDQFAVTLLTSEIPDGFGFAVYWSVIPFANWQYLGALTVSNPTAFFQSPWITSDPLENINTTVAPQGIQIGISLESLEFLNNVKEAEVKLPERSLGVDAIGIAKNLCNFIGSIDNAPPGFMNVVESWMNKFTSKLRFDPKFYLKNN